MLPVLYSSLKNRRKTTFPVVIIYPLLLLLLLLKVLLTTISNTFFPLRKWKSVRMLAHLHAPPQKRKKKGTKAVTN